MTGATSNDPVVRWASQDDLPGALRCYERNGYSGGIRAEDDVLVAERDGAIVGVARLVDEHGHRLLRGMFLDEAERGRGLGRRMLVRLVRRLRGRTCWLICGERLVSFYGAAGFAVAPEGEAPPHMPLRAADYARRHGTQVVMRREGGVR